MIVKQPGSVGGVSVPLFGVEKQSDAEAMPKQQISKSFMIIGPIKMNQKAIDVCHYIELTQEGVLVDETIVKAGVCAGCGRVFRSDSDVAGMCTFCHYSLCDECMTTYRCTKCGRSACPHCGQKDEDGQFVCMKCIEEGNF